MSCNFHMHVLFWCKSMALPASTPPAIYSVRRDARPVASDVRVAYGLGEYTPVKFQQFSLSSLLPAPRIEGNQPKIVYARLQSQLPAAVSLAAPRFTLSG